MQNYIYTTLHLTLYLTFHTSSYIRLNYHSHNENMLKMLVLNHKGIDFCFSHIEENVEKD